MCKLWNDVDDFFFPYIKVIKVLFLNYQVNFVSQVPHKSGVRAIIFNILNDREVKLIVNVANYLDTVLL